MIMQLNNVNVFFLYYLKYVYDQWLPLLLLF